MWPVGKAMKRQLAVRNSCHDWARTPIGEHLGHILHVVFDRLQPGLWRSAAVQDGLRRNRSVVVLLHE